MKTLFASGCSFTETNMLSYVYPEHRNSTCWPEELVKLFKNKWKVCNYAKSGMGNDFIATTFFEHIGNYGDPDLVVIAWSNSSRLSISGNGDEETWLKYGDYTFDPIWAYHQRHKLGAYWKHDKHGGVWNEFAFKYYEKFYPDSYVNFIVKNWLKNVFIIQDYCKMHNVPYAFSQAIQPVITGLKEVSDQLKYNKGIKNYLINTFINHNLEDKINENNFIGYPTYQEIGGFNLENLVRENKKFQIGVGEAHPNNEAHVHIGKLYYDNIKKNYDITDF